MHVRAPLLASVLAVLTLVPPVWAQDAPASTPAARQVNFADFATWKQIIGDVARDERNVVEFVVHAPRRRRDWLALAALSGATAGLVALDPLDTPPFRSAPSYLRFNSSFNGLNTGLGLGLLPAAWYAAGAISHNDSEKQTAFLAMESVADVQVITIGAKLIDRRYRPADVPTGGDYADTWFKAGFWDGKSFPSGHVVTAFALAQVFTERYGSHRWVPWLAYGTASLIGFSRVTLESHFPSDVFAGAVLGIVVPHYLVLR
jgi:membrane-associated phospholipid phosphatase